MKPLEKPAAPVTGPGPLVLGLAIVLAVALWENAHKSIWLDEAYSLASSDGGALRAFREAVRTEQQPPVYFVLLALWRTLSPSIEWARVLSTACAMGAVAVLHRMSRQLGIGARWWSLGLVAALSPHLLYAAAEARPYSLAVLLIAAASAEFYAAWTVGREPAPRGVRYGIAAWLALMTQYYAGFALAGQWAGAPLLGRVARRRIAWCVLVLALALLVWMPVVLWQVTHYGNYIADPVTSAHGEAARLVQGAAWLLDAARTVAFRGAPVVTRPGAAPLILALAAAIVAARAWRGVGRWTPLESVAVLGAVVPFAVLAFLRITRLALVDTRHWIVVLPGALVLLGLLLSRVRTGPLASGLAGAVLALFAVSTVSFVRNFTSPYDYRAAVRTMVERGPADRPILSLDAHDSLPVFYYYRRLYHRRGRFGAIPRGLLPDAWTGPRDDTTSVRAATDSLLRITGGRTRLWLLYQPWSTPDFNRRGFESDLKGLFRVNFARTYPGLRLLDVELRAAPGDSL
ncbi:MAG TPA: hypothetical protein VFW66_10075 [Gemmatimonadales bacterium]|nr:hypothetical protein [Gemmatimonadales bacterium]